MEGSRFDALTKGLARGTSRRKMLRGLIGGGAAVVAAKTGTTLAAKEEGDNLPFPAGQSGECSAHRPWERGRSHVANHGDFVFNNCCVDNECPGDQCNEGVCNEGKCGLTPANEDGGCDDGEACTENDVCTGGVCAGRNVPVDCGSASGVDGARVPPSVMVERRSHLGRAH